MAIGEEEPALWNSLCIYMADSPNQGAGESATSAVFKMCGMVSQTTKVLE